MQILLFLQTMFEINEEKWELKQVGIKNMISIASEVNFR